LANPEQQKKGTKQEARLKKFQKTAGIEAQILDTTAANVHASEMPLKIKFYFS
jgi:hypothetical protein